MGEKIRYEDRAFKVLGTARKMLGSVPSFKRKIRGMFWIAGILTLFIGIIPVRIAIAYHQEPRPRAILVLGGDFARMKSAARLAGENPDLNVWISDFSRFYAMNLAIFRELGVEERRIHYDGNATDTVTNFTGTVGDLTRSGIRHLYLVTSDYHMTRARAIATLVFGSRGVAITPVPVPSENRPPESIWRVSRDIIRSFLWIVTGRSGASLNPRLSNRFPRE